MILKFSRDSPVSGRSCLIGRHFLNLISKNISFYTLFNRSNGILLLRTATKNTAGRHDVQFHILLVESIALILLNSIENSLVNINLFLREMCGKNQIFNSLPNREPLHFMAERRNCTTVYMNFQFPAQ